jgi:prevent-host-death family protein
MDAGATIGVRELKARLSACLRRVRGGQRLTVTDRGRAVATLAPVESPATPDWLDSLMSAGVVQWAGGKPEGLPRRIPSRGKRASRMVMEDRR